MGKVGYYRYKVDDLQPGKYIYKWMVNDEVKCVSTVIVRPKCDESIYVKYLDKYGCYRFIQFNHYWTRTEQSSSLGTAESVANYNMQTSVGYQLNEVYTLSLEQVSPEELETYSQIFYSPDVFMQLDGEWKPVVVSGGDTVSRRNRKYNSKFQIEVTIKQPTITK